MNSLAAIKATPFDEAELSTLRAFYESWRALHKIPRDSIHRKQQEEAAQKLCDNATLLRRMYG